jgi:hypothetical protein
MLVVGTTSFASSQPPFEGVASGLNNPRHLRRGPPMAGRVVPVVIGLTGEDCTSMPCLRCAAQRRAAGRSGRATANARGLGAGRNLSLS